ncbi:Uncharacterised protein [Shigella sonnei]|nr:Uncharacterised protein [Shigella sonnei]
MSIVLRPRTIPFHHLAQIFRQFRNVKCLWCAFEGAQLMRVQPAIVMVKTIHRERLNSGQLRVLLHEIFPEGG